MSQWIFDGMQPVGGGSHEHDGHITFGAVVIGIGEVSHGIPQFGKP